MENELEDKSPFTKVVLTVVILAVLLVVGNLFTTSLLANRTVYADGWQVLVYESGSVIGNIKTLTEPSLERYGNGCYIFGSERYCGTVTIKISPAKVCTARCQ